MSVWAAQSRFNAFVKKRMEHKVGWIGKAGRSGRSWGVGEYDQNTPYGTVQELIKMEKKHLIIERTGTEAQHNCLNC